MRERISSKNKQKNKQKKNQLYLGIALSVLMLFSVFGVMVNSFGKEDEIEKITYNGLEFIKKNSIYELTIGGNDFYFSENPNNINDASYKVELNRTLPQYAGKPLYLDILDYEVTKEIYQNIEGYPLRIQNACYNEKDCPSKDFPIKDCSDNMIIIRESNQNRIYQNESCVFIQGDTEELIKLTDLFLLKIMGIN